ncbi:MAG: beta-galactosidase trimerization domain-containing protein, partial [Bryobacteraceae bacterium]|nr:beta-galactosidase trimerization domain-containing protein [Bryobacteraceae bacterium]
MPDLIRRDFLKLAASAGAFASAAAPPPQAEPLDQGIPLRFRQIHLDFHTSEHIADVGAAFDPDEFASILVKARVNSVTCFARCHHGWIYFDTKKHPERRHPHLKRNLLAEQIEACHRRNIRVPIYITVEWDHYSATRHPEWLILDEKGNPTGTPLYEPGFYRNLCLNSPYRDFLREHVEEVLTTLPVDGIFFDITHPRECNSHWCRQLMEKAGLDPTKQADRLRHALETVNEFKREFSALVRRYHPKATIFYNSGHIGPRHRAVAPLFTHFELESLPSGGWGYLHFPLTARYSRTLGVEVLGMTGKFHTSWGDFHSYKNRAALEFECFQMLALGAKCSVGDQLHPSGKMDPVSYELIGAVYAEVEKKEPWCCDARAVTEIGVLNPEEFAPTFQRTAYPSVYGAVRMLQELAHQFDVLDSKSDFSRYKLIVLPDEIPGTPELSAKLDAYVRTGGSVLASFASGLDPSRERFAPAALGVRLKGEAPYSPDFVLPRGALARGLRETEYVMYLRGKEVEPLAGSEVLAETVLPYFNRTWRHFCSHRHTPSAGKRGYPAVVRHGRAIYFAHPVFTQYYRNAPRWVKTLVGNAIAV